MPAEEMDMQSPPQKPSDVLRAWLDTQLESLPPGHRLPTDRELAGQFNVSERTARSILGLYHTEGKVVRVPGKGTFTTSDMPVRIELPERTPSAESLSRRIHLGIATGEYRAGEPLPSVKWLSREFRVSHKTVAQAYDFLERRRFIYRIGYRYWVGGFGQHLRRVSRPRKEIYLFLNNSSDFGWLFDEKLNINALSYRAMERELLKHGYLLRYESTARLHRLCVSWARRRHFPYGIILANITPVAFQAALPSLVLLRSGAGRAPVPILADIGMDTLLRGVPRNMHVIRCGESSTQVARFLAQYIVARHWHSATFFLEALSSQALRMLSAPFKMRTELVHMDRGFSLGIVVKRPPSVSRAERFWRDFFRQRRKDDVETILSKYVPTTMAGIENEISVCSDFSSCYALHRRRKVWIFRFCGHAAEALDWARENRIRVPQDLAIISLVDDPGMTHRGISCCIADQEREGHLMAHVLIGDIPVRRTTKGYVRVDPEMRERLTTP